MSNLKWNKKFKVAVFDMDGTLTDSMSQWKNIYFDLFNKINITYSDDILMKINHISMEARVDYLINEYKLSYSHNELRTIFLNVAGNYYKNKFKIKPFMLDVLKEFKNKNTVMVIASASLRECVEIFIKANKIENYIDHIVSLNEVSRPKNFPDIYLKAIEKNSAKAEECIVFEDSLIPIITAKKAGFTVCAVQDENSKNDEKEILKLADYSLGFSDISKDYRYEN